MTGRFFVWYLLLSLFVHNLCGLGSCVHPGLGYWIMDTGKTIMVEWAQIHRELFSIDTIKIATATIPIYLYARFGDHPVHHCFYDDTCHKNIHQTPYWLCKFVERLPDVGTIIYSSLAILSPHEDTRRMARIFAIGYISASIFKDMIKIAEGEAWVRPGNEHFCKKKTYGGFPSGHMIEATHLATVLGFEYGWKIGVPLGIIAAIVGGMLIGSNRHYASQVVAGAGIGFAYGLATHKVIQNYDQPFRYTFNYDDQGNSLLGIAYSF